MSYETGPTEGEIRGRFLVIRGKVMAGTATADEAKEANELLEKMKMFQAVRDHEPKA